MAAVSSVRGGHHGCLRGALGDGRVRGRRGELVLGLVGAGIDDWSYCSRLLRQFLHGWGANRAVDARHDKADLLRQIEALDARADSVGLDLDGWEARFSLDAALMAIHRQEEA